MKCSHCQRENSPPNARFCVDCGYILLQSCPYSCGHGALPVRASHPLPKCPSCDRFLMVCPLCHRLHPLGERRCSTARCALAGVRPIEPSAPHTGTPGGAPYVLQQTWTSAPLLPFSPTWNSDPSLRFGGLAARYGVVACWQGAQLLVWPAPRAGSEWPRGAPQAFALFEPPPGDELWPAHQNLLIAHGCAYALLAGGIARVPLGDEAVTRAAQNLTLRAPASPAPIAEPTELAWEFDPAPSEAGEERAPVWAPHEVHWLAQAETATFYFAVGESDGALVGVKARGNDALFEGEPWELPASLREEEWRELTVWNDAPLLRSRDALWCEEEGVWKLLFRAEGEPRTLEGTLSDGESLWLWGRAGQRWWASRRDAIGNAEVSLPLQQGDRIFPFPVVHGTRITTFQTGTQNAVVTLDTARPLDDARRQELPASLSVLWASAALHPQSNAHWLLFATDDGDLVRLWLMALAPQPEAPHELMKLRPSRDGRGAALRATLSANCLVLGCANEKGSWIRAFALHDGASGVTKATHNS